MSKTEQFVAYARELIGTPFHHQGRVPQVGIDCAGTVVIPANRAGFKIEDQSNYAHIPDGYFLEAVKKHCNLVEFKDLQLGDLVMFKFEKEAQHIGIVSSIEPLMMIHAWAQLNRKNSKVTENSIDTYWLTKLSGCYRIKE